jgi:hypothetical protein
MSTTSIAVRDLKGGPWQSLGAVRDLRATVDVAPQSETERAFTDWAGTVAAAPLSVWQQQKLRQAMQHALTLGRWVMALA